MYCGISAKLALLLHLAAFAGFAATLRTPCTDLSGDGDAAFRKSDFAAADSFYRLALSGDSDCARALWGLGRIEELHFRRASARNYFASAYRLDPQDPQIIRAYASVVTGRAAEATLLSNYIAVGGEGRQSVESALGQVEISRRLGSREIETLATPYQAYDLPMSPSYPNSARPVGMLLAVSINGAKPLRLIFDTGARGVLIRAKAAEKLGLEWVGASVIGGIGSDEPAKGWIGLADSLRIQNLQMRNCLIGVSSELPAGDYDGVIGSALSQRFLIRFDAGARRLELAPFPESDAASFTQERPWHGHDRVVAPEVEGLSQAHQVGHLLLIRERSGYFLLDTGSAFSALSLELARGFGSSPVAVAGLSGRDAGAVRISPVQFQIGLVDAAPIALNLREISRREGVEISGVIGYPAISKRGITINYRDGLVGGAGMR